VNVMMFFISLWPMRLLLFQPFEIEPKVRALFILMPLLFLYITILTVVCGEYRQTNLKESQPSLDSPTSFQKLLTYDQVRLKLE